MKKEDELLFWKEIWKIKNENKRPYFREIAQKLNMDENRAHYITLKWSKKELINWGVSPLAGWIEEGITEDDLK